MTSFLEHSLAANFNVQCMHVSNAALLIYDTIVNFADEEKYIWRAGWSLGKVLYIISRYFAFAEVFLYLRINFGYDLDPKQCHATFSAIAWFYIFGIVCSEAIMIMRTFAIYSRSYWILAYLVSYRLGTVIPSMIVGNQWNQGMKFIPSPTPTLLACVPAPDFSVKLWVDFLCVAIFDCNIVALTLWKAYKQWRSGITIHRLSKTIYRDGLWYFFVICAVSISNVILLDVQRTTLYFDFLVLFQRVIYALLASRIVINVRKVAETGAESGPNSEHVAFDMLENTEHSTGRAIAFCSDAGNTMNSVGLRRSSSDSIEMQWVPESKLEP